MKAIAQILCEISCTQDFQILLSKEHNSNQIRAVAGQRARLLLTFVKFKAKLNL